MPVEKSLAGMSGDRLPRLLCALERVVVRGGGEGDTLSSRGFCIQAYEAIFFPDLLSWYLKW